MSATLSLQITCIQVMDVGLGCLADALIARMLEPYPLEGGAGSNRSPHNALE